MEEIEVKLFVGSVYTITGRKDYYTLGDMAYGEWLVFKNNQPEFYLNAFEYGPDTSKYDYSNLDKKLKEFDRDLSLKQHFWGIKSLRGTIKSLKLKRLPEKIFRINP